MTEEPARHSRLLQSALPPVAPRPSAPLSWPASCRWTGHPPQRTFQGVLSPFCSWDQCCHKFSKFPSWSPSGACVGVAGESCPREPRSGQNTAQDPRRQALSPGPPMKPGLVFCPDCAPITKINNPFCALGAVWVLGDNVTMHINVRPCLWSRASTRSTHL